MEVFKVKTLILLFHNNFSNSKANAALAGATQRLCDVALVHMDSLYPDGRIDDEREVASASKSSTPRSTTVNASRDASAACIVSR